MFLTAFSDLSTTRVYAGGPIPIDKILWYSVLCGFEDEGDSEFFATVIREMDIVFLAQMRKEQEKKGDKYKRDAQANTPGMPTPRVRKARPPARRR